MKAAPLSIRDTKFLVTRLIQQAPTSTLVREFFKNADENAALAVPSNRKIRIYPVGGPQAGVLEYGHRHEF